MSMQWHTYITIHEWARRLRGKRSVPDINTFYRLAQERLVAEYSRRAGNPPTAPSLEGMHAEDAERIVAECQWHAMKRPYYNIWPAIADAFITTRLDLPCEFVIPILAKMPDAICIRFGVGQEASVPGGSSVRDILATKTYVEGKPGIAVWSNFGEIDPRDGVPVYDYSRLSLDAKTVSEAFDSLPSTLTENEDAACKASLSVFMCLTMLNDDPEFVTPVVLKRDRLKYRETLDPKYVTKAIRRGEHGWDVGAHVAASPHFRRPHFAIRWTGKGGAVPKLRPVKGCIVRRDRIADVPTGYLDQRGDVDKEAHA